ncbi:disulfide bond chaperone [Oleiharenicola sp. Vm1]|uniref:disulfide bond chaperone n=1 Tax=Oleiharenicola sp. Vm1 TaxID=3398393 RepID=UPI0039F4F709
MPESTPEPVNGAEIVTEFVRHRNVMLVRGDLGPLFVDYYLHLADHQLKPAPEHDRRFKQALAAFALHCASRPRFEHLAWTISLQDPRLNLFLAGDNEDCTVAGRIFTENVREAPQNVFYADLMPRRGAEKRRSVVNFDGPDLFRAVEHYYATSEQRPARYFDLGDDRFAMLVSHPDCDERWLREVDLAGVKAVAEHETVAHIERRAYRWNCGCTQQKILGALAPAARQDLGGLFGGEESIHVQCPRCAAAHILTREAMEAFLAATKK